MSAPPTPTPESQIQNAAQTEYAAWVHLRRILNNKLLQPGSTPFIPTNTPFYMIPNIQGSHQAGLLTAVSNEGTVTSFNLHDCNGTAAPSTFPGAKYVSGSDVSRVMFPGLPSYLRRVSWIAGHAGSLVEELALQN